ncbi:MAG: STAS domain-containing protein [Calditrichae bacterium]|nr:STAS domain-containing protein [Calditrichota bacterium]MCB9058620.1 STAS domain-containing protein [Calditrichia bacterium]
MKFKDKIYGDVGVISLKGKLMGLPETDELQDEVRAMLGQKINKIVLDLDGVKWMNSLGIGAIMRSHTTVSNSGGRFCLARISEKVNSVLVLTQLINIFETFDNVDDAVKSFS